MWLRGIATVLLLLNWSSDTSGQLHSPVPNPLFVAASTLATAAVLFVLWAVEPPKDNP